MHRFYNKNQAKVSLFIWHEINKCNIYYDKICIREKYNLKGSVARDALVHCCCHCIAIAQVWNEFVRQEDAIIHVKSYLKFIN